MADPNELSHKSDFGSELARDSRRVSGASIVAVNVKSHDPILGTVGKLLWKG